MLVSADNRCNFQQVQPPVGIEWLTSSKTLTSWQASSCTVRLQVIIYCLYYLPLEFDHTVLWRRPTGMWTTTCWALVHNSTIHLRYYIVNSIAVGAYVIMCTYVCACLMQSCQNCVYSWTWHNDYCCTSTILCVRTELKPIATILYRL